MPRMSREHPLLILLDGHALVHRAYHALQGNTRTPGVRLSISKTGEPTGAVYGFAQTLLKVLGELKPDYIAVTFDRPGPTFRHIQYPEYKAQRAKAPDDLVRQFSGVRELVDAFNIPIYELDGYEADDVLGTLCRQASAEGVETVVVTGDADTMQLVSPQVRVLYPGRSLGETILFDEDKVKERYGVTPEQIPDFKGLKGDPSDNIPGVPGVGDKTAARLLQAFGSLEGIYENLGLVSPPKVQDLLTVHQAQARQSKELAIIVTEAPIALNLEACRWGDYDRSKVMKLFREMEFASLLSRLPSVVLVAPTAQTQEPPHQMTLLSPEATPVAQSQEPEAPLMEARYQTVEDERALDSLVARLSSAGSFVVDVETTSLNPMEARLVGIALSPASRESYYIPVGHPPQADRQLPKPLVLERLRPLLESPEVAKIAHNANYDMIVLAEEGINLKNFSSDTMVAAHLLGEKALGLKSLAFSRLEVEMTPISELIGTGAKQITMAQVPVAQAAPYACADADMTGRLNEIFERDLKERGLWELFVQVEMPLVPVLVQMERNGVLLDTSFLAAMAKELRKRTGELEAEIYNQVGHQFNINSTQQLGVILFEELHLPRARRTKSGYSTDAAVLEGLRGTHPVIEFIQEYRQLAKLKSTYVDALPALVNPKTGRVHTSFNQASTATGRISSSDPNLQNIPVRTELGGQVRAAFVAPKGAWLLSADYSQVELRILAHLSQDPRLLDAFHRDEDIHAATASEVFGVPKEAVTPQHRRIAKIVNFGVAYGLSGYGLAQQVAEFSQQEATQFIISYFEKYPGLREYSETTKKFAAQHGYVQTVLGRRRYIPEIHSANAPARQGAERMAINMPVQGTAADIIKLAMIQLQGLLEERGLKSKLLLQVHDELLLEVPEEELEEMRRLVPEVMSGAFKLTVPLKVDVKVGRNWGEIE